MNTLIVRTPCAALEYVRSALNSTATVEYSTLLHEARRLCCASVRVLERSHDWRRSKLFHGVHLSHKMPEHRGCGSFLDTWPVCTPVDLPALGQEPSTFAITVSPMCDGTSCRTFVALHEPRQRTVSSDNICHFCRSRKQRRQLAPYLSSALKWKTVQALNWRTSQLVNTLELASLLNYLRPFPARGEIISCRLFHVFDSLVKALLVAKGRSSSFSKKKGTKTVCAAY